MLKRVEAAIATNKGTIALIKIVIASGIVSDKQKVVGMIGGAILWETIEKKLDSIKNDISKKYKWSPKFFLTSIKGIYWYHWDPEKTVHILKNESGDVVYNDFGEKVTVQNNILEEPNQELSVIGRDIIKGKEGFGTFKSVDTGEMNFIVYAPINVANYSIAMIVPLHQIMLPVKKLQWYFIVILILAIGLVLSVSLFLSKKISKPIIHLNDAVKNITSGMSCSNISVWPKTGKRILLKSWAIPPASVPMDSIFCAC